MRFLWKILAPADSFAQNMYVVFFILSAWYLSCRHFTAYLQESNLLRLWAVLPFRFYHCLQLLPFPPCLLCFRPNFINRVKNANMIRQCAVTAGYKTKLISLGHILLDPHIFQYKAADKQSETASVAASAVYKRSLWIKIQQHRSKKFK